jgi:cytochrome c
MRSALAGTVLAAALALPTLAQAQDAAAGQKDFVVCRACHQIGPGAKNAVGPELNGVVGRKAGSVPGYQYSEANKSSGITWTKDELQKYLANPQAVVKGTKMIFPGFHNNTKKIDDVIAFLDQYGPDGQKKQ